MVSFNSKREKEILGHINTYRQENNLKPYIWNDFMANLARHHSQNMAEHRVSFSHDGYEDRLNQVKHSNPVYLGGSENVAYSKPGDHNPIDQWKKSEGHNKNLLGKFTHCGVGWVQNKDLEFYYTALFAKLS